MSTDNDANITSIASHINSVMSGEWLWVLFGYRGKSFILEYIDRGKEKYEFLDQLNSQGLLFVYFKYFINETCLPKFVLISWSGACLPEWFEDNISEHIERVKNMCEPLDLYVEGSIVKDINFEEINNQLLGISRLNNELSATPFTDEQSTSCDTVNKELPETIGNAGDVRGEDSAVGAVNRSHGESANSSGALNNADTSEQTSQMPMEGELDTSNEAQHPNQTIDSCDTVNKELPETIGNAGDVRGEDSAVGAVNRSHGESANSSGALNNADTSEQTSQMPMEGELDTSNEAQHPSQTIDEKFGSLQPNQSAQEFADEFNQEKPISTDNNDDEWSNGKIHSASYSTENNTNKQKSFLSIHDRIENLMHAYSSTQIQHEYDSQYNGKKFSKRFVFNHGNNKKHSARVDEEIILCDELKGVSVRERIAKYKKLQQSNS